VFCRPGGKKKATRRERYHDAGAMATGALMNPGTPPYARVTYVAYYPDPIGRPQARTDYGTNGGAALVRSSTIPASSDTVLVSSLFYDSTGNLLTTTDPAGTVNLFGYDAAGRRVSIMENHSGGGSSSGACAPSVDGNRTTNLTYSQSRAGCARQ